MAKMDPEQERQRLAEFYASQMDGKLEKVAGEAYELSDLAKDLLRAELEKRGLHVELAQHAPVRAKKAPEPGDPQEESEEKATSETDAAVSDVEYGTDADFEGMVIIRQFRDLPQALLAKGSLESAGIECALVDDNVVRMDWFWSNAMGGIKVMVKAEDASASDEVLNQPIPEHLEVPGIGDYEQPRCPKCGSLDINFRELDPATYLGLGGSCLGVFIPIPLYRRAWNCHACNAEWEEVEETGAPASSS